MGFLNFFSKNNRTLPDPYWEFNPQLHYRPKLPIGDFFRLSGSDFCWFALEPISDYIGDTEKEIELGKHLSPAQKALYYWWYVDSQVMNGGFIQFFFNGYGHYVPTILKSLRYIGDNEMANLIEKASSIYHKNTKHFEKAHENDADGFSALYNNERLDELGDCDDDYYNINNNTMETIEKYFRSHPNEVAVDENGNEIDSSFTGSCKTYYEEGNLKETFELKSGAIEGEFILYYKNGQSHKKTQYKNGTPTGEVEVFYEDGSVSKHVINNTTTQTSCEEVFYPNGILEKRIYRSLETNEQIGLYEEWYDNGQLAQKGNYLSDYKRHGQWLEFYKNGSKKSEIEYRDDRYYAINYWNEQGEQLLINGTGLYIHSYDDDIYETEYKDYKRHGVEKTYTKGILRFYQEMEYDVEHGKTCTYYNNGNLKTTTIYENGEKVSEEKFRIFPNPEVVPFIVTEIEDEWLINRGLEAPDTHPVLINGKSIETQLQVPLSLFEGYDDDHEIMYNYFMTVNDNGKVIDYKYIMASNLKMIDKIESIIPNLEFTPAITNEKPVTSSIFISYRFKLANKG